MESTALSTAGNIAAVNVAQFISGAHVAASHCSDLEQVNPSAKKGLFDIPPELRNRIYEELLRFGPLSKTGCHPQILATCSQARQEATEILYELNSFTITLRSNRDPYSGQEWCTAIVSSDMFELSRSLDIRSRTGTILTTDWPRFLAKIKNLTLSDYSKGLRFLPTRVWDAFIIFLADSCGDRHLSVDHSLGEPWLSLTKLDETQPVRLRCLATEARQFGLLVKSNGPCQDKFMESLSSGTETATVLLNDELALFEDCNNNRQASTEIGRRAWSDLDKWLVSYNITRENQRTSEDKLQSMLLHIAEYADRAFYDIKQNCQRADLLERLVTAHQRRIEAFPAYLIPSRDTTAVGPDG